MGTESKPQTRGYRLWEQRVNHRLKSTSYGNRDYRVHVDWRWPLSSECWVKMVISAQLAEGGGACPTHFNLFTSSTRVLSPPPHPFPARLARYSYLYYSILPLSPSFWKKPRVPVPCSIFLPNEQHFSFLNTLFSWTFCSITIETRTW